MNKDEFVRRVLEQREMLYFVSYGILKNSADQEDAVQECLHKALVKRETLRNPQYLKTWLTRILINECHNVIRKRKREIPTDESLFVEVPPTADIDLFDSMVELEEKLRLPLVLHYLQGYTTKEIARILLIPEGTVKSRLRKARKMLGEHLEVEV